MQQPLPMSSKDIFSMALITVTGMEYLERRTNICLSTVHTNVPLPVLVKQQDIFINNVKEQQKNSKVKYFPQKNNTIFNDCMDDSKLNCLCSMTVESYNLMQAKSVSAAPFGVGGWGAFNLCQISLASRKDTHRPISLSPLSFSVSLCPLSPSLSSVQ